MKKRILTKITVAILGFIICFSGLTGCKPNGETQNFHVKVVPATVKYKLDQEIADYSDSVSIAVAKNEYESAQIVVTPEQNVRDMNVEITDLTCGEEKIPSTQINVYWEHYVYLDKNDIKNSEKTGFAQGYYPDALVPMDLRREAKENKIRAGENQGIWLTVKTLPETIAGVYTGNIRLTGDGYAEEIPISVRVFDFILSSEKHFMTAFAIWDGMPDDMLFQAYQSSDAQIAENYYEFMLEYRVSPTHIPNMSKLTLQEQTETFLEYIKRADVGSLALPYTVTDTQIGFDVDRMRYILNALADCAMTDHTVLDKAYAYFTFIDEPTANTYARVKLVNETFHELLTEVAESKLYQSGMEEMKAKFLDIECVNTTAYAQDKVDVGLVTDGDNIGIDTWCPTFDYFNSEKYRYEIEQRLAAGDGVWWYGCVEPRNPFPTFSVNDHLMPQRFVSWMQMEYGIEGQLFWATNAYEQYSYEKLDYVYRDVWKDAVAFPSVPGDGYLTYPGYKYGLYSPIPTIRLDNFRAAQEDYEYLYHLKKLFEEKKPDKIGYDFNTYVGNLYRQLYQGVIARNDSVIFEQVRMELANLIELAEKGIFVDISTNVVNNNCTVTVYGKGEMDHVTLNGKEMKASESQGTYQYTGNFIVTSQNAYATVRLEVNGTVLEVKRFTGGNFRLYQSFDTEESLKQVTLSKCNRLDSDDLKAQLSDKALNNKSLKVTYEVPTKPVLGYLPTVTVKNSAALDFSVGEIFRADVFNESSRNVELTIILADDSGEIATLYKAYLQPNVWNHIEILACNADIKLLDLKNIREIRFLVESLTDVSDNMTLYYDNIYLSNRGAV